VSGFHLAWQIVDIYIIAVPLKKIHNTNYLFQVIEHIWIKKGQKGCGNPSLPSTTSTPCDPTENNHFSPPSMDSTTSLQWIYCLLHIRLQNIVSARLHVLLRCNWWKCYNTSSPYVVMTSSSMKMEDTYQYDVCTSQYCLACHSLSHVLHPVPIPHKIVTPRLLHIYIKPKLHNV